MRLADGVQRRVFRQAGIDHEDVDPARIGRCAREGAVELLAVGGVGAQEADAVRTVRRPVAARLSARGEDRRAFNREALGDRAADAADPAHHHGDLVCQPVHATLLSGPTMGRRY